MQGVCARAARAGGSQGALLAQPHVSPRSTNAGPSPKGGAWARRIPWQQGWTFIFGWKEAKETVALLLNISTNAFVELEGFSHPCHHQQQQIPHNDASFMKQLVNYGAETGSSALQDTSRRVIYPHNLPLPKNSFISKNHYKLLSIVLIKCNISNDPLRSFFFFFCLMGPHSSTIKSFTNSSPGRLSCAPNKHKPT